MELHYYVRLSAFVFSQKKFLVHLFAEERLKLPLLSGASKYKKQHAIMFVKTGLSSAYFIFHMTI